MTLKCETDTEEMAQRVREAFYVLNLEVDEDTIEVFFEHGQWWVRCEDECGEPVTFSCVDALGTPDVVADGFSFERV